jgi:hypothetical protein
VLRVIVFPPLLIATFTLNLPLADRFTGTLNLRVTDLPAPSETTRAAFTLRVAFFGAVALSTIAPDAAVPAFRTTALTTTFFPRFTFFADFTFSASFGEPPGGRGGAMTMPPAGG